MKFNKTILIFSIVLISLLAVSTVSASENASDVIEVAEDNDVVAVENDLNQNTAEILTENNEEESVASIVDDAPLADNSSKVSEITIYSGDKPVSSFNFTSTDGSYDFSEIMEMLKQSDLNMSNFGNFADLFNNFNFTGQNKTFDFKIAGDVNGVQYRLAIASLPEKFVFDYMVKSPNLDNEFNNISTNDLRIFVDGKFLTDITFNANALNMEELMKMFNFDSSAQVDIKEMMSQFNFADMAAQFGNATFDTSNKTFDFKIDGEVGNIKYDLIINSTGDSFVFDYKIRSNQLQVTIDVTGLKVPTVNTAVDGKIGKNLTITLKDQFGKVLSNQPLEIVLNNKVYNLNTGDDGKVNIQLNIAKAGKYAAAITFLGDNTYVGQFKAVTVTVTKQTPKLAVAKKTYKAKAKTKKLTATFKSAKGKAIKGKKITFNVKGKTYTAKTNAKGVATVNVKLTKKGTYNFSAKFAGDSTYNAIKKSSKLVIK